MSRFSLQQTLQCSGSVFTPYGWRQSKGIIPWVCLTNKAEGKAALLLFLPGPFRDFYFFLAEQPRSISEGDCLQS